MVSTWAPSVPVCGQRLSASLEEPLFPLTWGDARSSSQNVVFLATFHPFESGDDFPLLCLLEAARGRVDEARDDGEACEADAEEVHGARVTVRHCTVWGGDREGRDREE